MSVSKRLRSAGTLVLFLVLATSSVQAATVETGPVSRKWGLGWDDGLTARLWLGGVWELGLSAGPDDYLNDRVNEFYDTGGPPEWNENSERSEREDKRESGYVRVQAGRLLARRGPLAMVCFTGLEYLWSDSRYSYLEDDVDYPQDTRRTVEDYDRSTWTLTLGIRPSFVILDFLTLETAFRLNYIWGNYENVERTTYPETGRVRMEVTSEDGNSFSDRGWSGMGSLQFIVWF